MNIRNILYSTDIGYVFEEFEEVNATKIEPYTESVDNRSEGLFPGNFVVFSIQTSAIKQVFNRSYIKIQNLLANIGGVIEGVLFLAGPIQNYFASTLYILQLANDILRVDHVQLANGNMMESFTSTNKCISVGTFEKTKVIEEELSIKKDNFFKLPDKKAKRADTIKK